MGRALTFVSSGDQIQVKALASDVSAGTLTRQRGILGVPVDHSLAGSTVLFDVSGVHAITYSVSINAGSFLYWDTAAGGLTTMRGAGVVFAGQVTKTQDSNNVINLLLSPIEAPHNNEQV